MIPRRTIADDIDYYFDDYTESAAVNNVYRIEGLEYKIRFESRDIFEKVDIVNNNVFCYKINYSQHKRKIY